MKEKVNYKESAEAEGNGKIQIQAFQKDHCAHRTTSYFLLITYRSVLRMNISQCSM